MCTKYASIVCVNHCERSIIALPGGGAGSSTGGGDGGAGDGPALLVVLVMVLVVWSIRNKFEKQSSSRFPKKIIQF